jgi:hypothetical protein
MQQQQQQPQQPEEGSSLLLCLSHPRHADVDDGSGAEGGEGGEGEGPGREQDRLLPAANIGRIMKRALPENAKIAKDAKDTMQAWILRRRPQ